MASRNTCIYLASVVPRLPAVLNKVLPSCEIKVVKLGQNGHLSGENIELLQKNAEILFADAPVINAVVSDGSKVKWAQSTWAGVENILKVFPSRPEGVIITRMGEGFGSLMAQYVLGHIISRERYFPEMMEMHKQKIWDNLKFRDFRMLHSLTAGVLGIGQIGSEIARTLQFFGMRTVGLGRTKRKSPGFNDVKSTSEMTEFLKDSDYLVNVLPSTAETKNLLSGDVLQACSKKPFFINVGRGDIIDTNSLSQAISNGWLTGAVLDVVDQEPLPQDHPLWTTPNVLITPHISGPCAAEPLADAFARNLSKYLEGKPLDYEIKWDLGY